MIEQYRFFAKDVNGRDLFYMVLDNYDNLPQLFFRCSLRIEISEMQELRHLVNKICQLKISDVFRLKLANELIIQIKKIPGIEEYYFPDYLLNKDGIYQEFVDKTVWDILMACDDEDYTAYNTDNHPILFRALSLILKEWKLQGKGMEVDKLHFVELLPNNPLLQELYVEYYSNTLMFYYFQFEDIDNASRDIYCLIDDKKIKFAFSRRTPLSK